nr:dsRBD fold-containing protein [Mycobacterium sp.]
MHKLEVALSRIMIRKMLSMHLTLAIDEHHGRTYAKVELRCQSSRFFGQGVAYRHPSDYLSTETGQQLATARALSDLADQVNALSRIKN